MKIIRQDYTEIGDGVAETPSISPKRGLSVIFAIMCIVDLFGVFPIIALPKNVISCGVYAIPMVLAVIGLQLYTAVLLGRCWLLAQEITPHIKEKNRYPYAAVAELAFGPVGKRTVTLLLNATVFGSGIPNFILAAQSLQLFWWKITGGGVGVTYCVWMLLLALLLCPIMWLGSPKDMKPIAFVSVLIVSTVAIATWSSISLDNVSPAGRSVLAARPQLKDFLSAYGVLAFQFDIHPMLLTIQVDMRDGRQINKAVAGGFAATLTLFTVTTVLAGNRYGVNVENNVLQGKYFDGRQINKAVAGGFAATLTLFTVTTVLAGNRYGVNVENNVLQGIPPSIPLYVVALLVTVQLCLSSAVGNSVLFQQIEDYFRIPRNFCWQRILIRSSIVALAVFLAESVPRFDLVMGLVGSTLTGPLMFIFPPIFFLKLCYIKSQMVKKDPLKFGRRVTPQNGVLITNGDGMRITNNDDVNTLNGEDVLLILEDELIINGSLQKYKTFTNKYYKKIYADTDDDYTIKWYDVMFASIVMSLGMLATVVATYSSWATNIQYASYSPPCLVNATIAARSFLSDL